MTSVLIFLSYLREERVNELVNGNSINHNNNNESVTNNNIDAKKSSANDSQQSFYDKLLESFSIRKNWQTIVNDKSSPDAIPIINGLK